MKLLIVSKIYFNIGWQEWNVGIPKYNQGILIKVKFVDFL